ncbi:MAG: site-specific tyrosine recombinase XerD [Dehalococcoidia bacterium]|nr:site-specific tyrosine recombinase XerD [Dehalococcoidia bacterium]
MKELVDRFLQVLAVEKGFSPNTQFAYRNDLHQLADFLQKTGVRSWVDVTLDNLSAYVLAQKGKAYSTATMARKIASLKSFFNFLVQEEVVKQDPTEDISSPKLGRRLPKPLTEAEITRLLDETARTNGPDGLRDRALLELLYATGMRVSELVSLNLPQLHLTPSDGFVRCFGKGGKERLIQIHDEAVSVLQGYITKGRPQMVTDGQHAAVFVNHRGERLTRQGCWLILKEYAQRAHIGSTVTPHVLRHSFATHMLRGGATLRQVQEWLGHASITTTQVYTLLTDRYVQEQYEKAHPRAG